MPTSKVARLKRVSTADISSSRLVIHGNAEVSAEEGTLVGGLVSVDANGEEEGTLVSGLVGGDTNGEALKFNQDISKWSVGSVTDFGGRFVVQKVSMDR